MYRHGIYHWISPDKPIRTTQSPTLTQPIQLMRVLWLNVPWWNWHFSCFVDWLISFLLIDICFEHYNHTYTTDLGFTFLVCFKPCPTELEWFPDRNPDYLQGRYISTVPVPQFRETFATQPWMLWQFLCMAIHRNVPVVWCHNNASY
jgi:hypothetical protein